MAAKDEGKGTRRRKPPTPDTTPAPQEEQARPRRKTARRPESAEEPSARGTAPSESPTNQQAETTQARPRPAPRRPRRRAGGPGETPPGGAAAESPRAGQPEVAAREDLGAAGAGPEIAPEPAAAAAENVAAAAVVEGEMGEAEAVEEAGLAESAATEAATPATEEQAGFASEDVDLLLELGEEAEEEGVAPAGDGAALPERPRRERHRAAHGNALGVLIERQFADPVSPCRSYSDLERHSGISREALSRYVTARPDRRRSPTIDTLVAIADAMHLSLESIARAAAASVKGVMPPPEDEQQARQEVLGTLVAALTPEQFGAVVELLRQLRPIRSEQ